MSEVGEASFPFTAVVGQDELKLALTLAAIDPHIGGVLARGEKGSGKTTLARGFARVLGDGAPFVELPLGATEDRVLGSIDITAVLAGSGEVLRPGLLAGADGGVVYVDEINLLADHLVDSLLDVAVSGTLRVERDGVAATQRSRFVLLGTMNPEEGELRPQLLDRFGLCVDVHAPDDVEARVEAVARRLAFEHGELVDGDDDYRRHLATVRPAVLDREVMRFAAALALAVGAEGLRSDLVLCRAAAALAGWEGRSVTTTDDVEQVAPLVLAHRRRRHPFDPPTLDQGELDDAIDRAREQLDRPPGDAGGDDPDGPRDDGAGTAEGQRRPVVLGAERQASITGSRGVAAGPTPSTGRRGGGGAPSPRGRFVRDVDPAHPHASGVAIAATVRNVAARRGDVADGMVVDRRDLRAALRQEPLGALVVVALDTSGSMGATERVEAATGVVLGVLADAYRRRERVALVTFGGAGARTVLAPTGSIEIARRRLAELETGGTTPLAAGLRQALAVAVKARRDEPERPVVMAVVTDGRATGPDPAAAWSEAVRAAGDIAAMPGIETVVVDAETGTPRLGLAAELAAALDGRRVSLSEFSTAVTAGARRP